MQNNARLSGEDELVRDFFSISLPNNWIALYARSTVDEFSLWHRDANTSSMESPAKRMRTLSYTSDTPKGDTQTYNNYLFVLNL